MKTVRTPGRVDLDDGDRILTRTYVRLESVEDAKQVGQYLNYRTQAEVIRLLENRKALRQNTPKSRPRAYTSRIVVEQCGRRGEIQLSVKSTLGAAALKCVVDEALELMMAHLLVTCSPSIANVAVVLSDFVAN